MYRAPWNNVVYRAPLEYCTNCLAYPPGDPWRVVSFVIALGQCGFAVMPAMVAIPSVRMAGGLAA